MLGAINTFLSVDGDIYIHTYTSGFWAMLGSGYESLPSRVLLKRQSSQTHTCTRVQADRSEKGRELQRNTGPERETEREREREEPKKERKPKSQLRLGLRGWS